MNELERIVAILSSYVVSETMEVPDSVKNAAGIYAEQCRIVNERLADCGYLLKSHQVDEAIRQSQLEPDLLALFDTLAFAEAEQWGKTAEYLRLAVPQRLNFKMATRLNEAHSKSKSTEDLLRQHRFLALSREPLRRRLDVVRLLSQARPSNQGWAADVQRYEAACFEEMRATFDDPMQSNNWAIIRTLLDQLNDGTWSNKPPMDLLIGVQERHSEMRRKQGERLLRVLNPQILNVIADDRDERLAKQLEAQAQNVIEEYKIPENAAIAQPLQQISAWIDKRITGKKNERQYDAAVDQLRNALKDGVSWSYIQYYYGILIEFNRPIPRDVAERYAAKAQFRFMVKVLGAAGATAIVLAGIALRLSF
jgi:hypothetical protein